MKKVFAILAIVALTACGSNNNTAINVADSTAVAADSTSVDSTAAVTDSTSVVK